MNANALARHYDRLGAEERFRLILAAGARGDDAEQDRLCQTAPRITLSYSHHAPWAQAFDQLAMLVYMELLEEVAKHQDAFDCWCDVAEDCDDDATPHDDCEDEEDEGEEGEENERDATVTADNGPNSPLWVRMLELYYAQGFILKTEFAGWKLLCQRLTLPPFVLWQSLPGFDRLQRTIDLVENRGKGPSPAFEPEGMLNWLNRVRPDGQPEATLEALSSPGRSANDLEIAFRRLVEWWGG